MYHNQHVYTISIHFVSKSFIAPTFYHIFKVLIRNLFGKHLHYTDFTINIGNIGKISMYSKNSYSFSWTGPCRFGSTYFITTDGPFSSLITDLLLYFHESDTYTTFNINEMSRWVAKKSAFEQKWENKELWRENKDLPRAREKILASNCLSKDLVIIVAYVYHYI